MYNRAAKVTVGVYYYRGSYIAHIGEPFGWATVYPDKLDTMDGRYVGKSLQAVMWQLEGV